MTVPQETRPGAPYEVIARRYRPRTFREVVGQEAIAETLRQGILQERLGHAYLFSGPRGVGKTSMARIFARALQCPDSKDGDPCGQCGLCDRIFRGDDVDVVEMDGASHRGIDDMRELIQHVRYAPTAGPYRIFIIDEVHMLTREAFNSLLKTLEEPPAHVKFFFATTEPEKVLPTVLSRCQRFDFSPISPSDIVRRLEQICAAEGATPEAGLLDRIAALARGGMRDSQSLLDQLLSFAGNTPSTADLDSITGRLAPEEVDALLERIERGERAEVVRRLEEIGRGGTDPAVLLEQVIETLRDRLHDGVAAGWGDTEIDRNLLAQEILQEARMRVRRLGRADLVLELALLRLSTLVDLVPLSRWQDALGVGEGAIRHEADPRGGAESRRTEITRSEAPGIPSRRAKASPPAESPQTETAPPKQPDVPTPPRITPRDHPPAAMRTDDEASAEGGGVAKLRAAFDEGKRSPRSPAKQEPPRVSAAVEVGADDPPGTLRAALDEISPSLVRVVGDQFGLEKAGDEWTLSLSAPALGVLGERRDSLRRDLARALGASVRVELGDFGGSDLPSEEPAGSEEVPEIVEKAREIFRGELFRGGPPSRRGESRGRDA